MNELQKEHVIKMLRKAWSIHNIPPHVERQEDGKILKIRFLRNNRDLMRPLCWCFQEGCEDCEKTREREENEMFRCKMSCSEIKKCYLCT